jgi:import inner membrane translocase subunit TIM21
MIHHQVLSLRKAIPASQTILARTRSIVRNYHGGKSVVAVSTLCQNHGIFSLVASWRHHPGTIPRFTSSWSILANRWRLSSSSTKPSEGSTNNVGKEEVRIEGDEKEGGNTQDKTNYKSDPWDDGSGTSNQVVAQTPGQKFQEGTARLFWFGVFSFAVACAYYIFVDLFPSKTTPNTVFDLAFHVLRNNPEIQERFGEPLKAYGRDHGGYREGRRNFIEHTKYTCKEDGSKRTRIRFNLEGKFGNAFVFAEVSKEMPRGEFVYLIVQDKRNGKVITLIDNRTALTVKQMAGDSKEGNEALQTLMFGGGSSSKRN